MLTILTSLPLQRELNPASILDQAEIDNIIIRWGQKNLISVGDKSDVHVQQRESRVRQTVMLLDLSLVRLANPKASPLQQRRHALPGALVSGFLRRPRARAQEEGWQVAS